MTAGRPCLVFLRQLIRAHLVVNPAQDVPRLLPRILRELSAAVGTGDLAKMEDLIGQVKRSAASEGNVPISRRAAEFEQQLQRTDEELSSLQRAVQDLANLCAQATADPADRS